jgi:ligand-binding sensor domain-containing protein
MYRLIRFLLITHLFLGSIVFAAIGDWTTITNKGDIRSLKIIGETVWCATNGGIFRYNIIDSSYTNFTNTDGLTSIDIKTLEIDNEKNVWAGTKNGHINVYQAKEKRWEIIDDIIENEKHEIFDFALCGDSLFIGLDIGISLYHHISDPKKREVKETYKNLGRGFNVEVPVKKIYIHNRDIWAATDYGIAKSNLGYSNLLDPSFWTNYTAEKTGLISNTIRDICSLNDEIFIATDKGIAKFDGEFWTIINTGLDEYDVQCLTERFGQLFAATNVSVYKYVDSKWQKMGANATNITSLAIDDQQNVWISRAKLSTINSEGGFAMFNIQKASWQFFIPPGPGGNTITNLAIDQKGVLWCCTRYDGFASYDGNQWNVYRSNAYGFERDDFRAVLVDRSNNKWFGSWGGGMVKITANDSLIAYRTDRFCGIDNYPNFVVITNIAIDSKDNIWFLNYAAANGNGLVVTTPQNQWQYFAAQDILQLDPTLVVYGLLIDRYDRIWVGSDKGIRVINVKDTPLDKSDDVSSGKLTKNDDGLVYDDVKTIVEDYDGAIWIGTPQGVNYWQDEHLYSPKESPIHNNIQSIAVDIRNNKWFGTAGGVSVLSSDNSTWTHYTTETSTLVGDNVTCFAFDEQTGKTYIGTSSGISVLETPYAKSAANLESITAGPNPFILKNGNYFTLYKLSDNVSIKILSSTGSLIRYIPKDKINGYYEWDGTDGKGNFVASGVYLYLLYNDKLGTSMVGKVAVIRE